jgi:phosphatidylglycerophosphatase C
MGFPMSMPRKYLGMLSLCWTVFLFVLRLRDHGQVKSAFIRSTLRGQPRAKVEAWTAKFVPAVLATGVFKDALSRIEQHRKEGARLVLMSASTDLYVPAFGAALGFDEVICTGVRWDGDSLDGHLTTPNRRGAEKTRCFERIRQGFTTAAYGNAGSDLDHMRLADQPLLVNASASTKRAAESLGVPVADTWR